jgi:hypothetical protein
VAIGKAANMREAYELSYRKACKALAESDLEEVCRRTGAVLNGRTLSVVFFESRVEIRLPEVEFFPADLPLVEKILILHYLTTVWLASTQGRAPAIRPASPDGQAAPGGQAAPSRPERLVSFKNLPGAAFYAVPYQKRGPARIARRFGANPEDFRRACSSLGWTPESFGDLAYSFAVFPRVRAVVVLNLSDEEFPAEAGILHNEGIVDFLPLEDVAVLGGSIATRLARAL